MSLMIELLVALGMVGIESHACVKRVPFVIGLGAWHSRNLQIESPLHPNFRIILEMVTPASNSHLCACLVSAALC
jgi:hypothetical protein